MQNDAIIPYQPAQIIRSPINQTSTIKTPAAITTSTAASVSIPQITPGGTITSVRGATPSETMLRPKRSGSIGLFFRKVSLCFVDCCMTDFYADQNSNIKCCIASGLI